MRTPSLYWTIVILDPDDPSRDGKPVVPLDTNPESDDDGMLVYRSELAAVFACRHQESLYTNPQLRCQPCRLDLVTWGLRIQNGGKKR